VELLVGVVVLVGELLELLLLDGHLWQWAAVTASVVDVRGLGIGGRRGGGEVDACCGGGQCRGVGAREVGEQWLLLLVVLLMVLLDIHLNMRRLRSSNFI